MARKFLPAAVLVSLSMLAGREAGADPVAFRLAHMKDPRARAVIEKVAEIAGWRAGEKGALSKGRGVGFSNSFQSCIRAHAQQNHILTTSRLFFDGRYT